MKTAALFCGVLRKALVKIKKLAVILFTVVVLALAVIGANKFFPDKVFVAKSAVMGFFGGEKAQITAARNIKTEKLDMESLLSSGAVKDDSLMLINSSYPLSEDYEPMLTDLGGVYINSCAAPAYHDIKTAVKEKFDNSLYIMSAYRTEEEQLSAMESEGEFAASLGESEHQAGLGVDVYVKYFAGEGFISCEEGQFVNSNCQDYGFIIRYPYYGTAVTGISYEPWHLRYVGFPHAEIIMKNSLTLEEYLNSLEPGNFYLYGDYIISRQKLGGELFIPAGISETVLSEDNTGHIVITGKYK